MLNTRAFLVVAAAVVFALSGCTSGSVGSSDTDESAAPKETQNEEEVPSETSTPTPSETLSEPAVITYQDVVTGPLTNAEICDSYTELIDDFTAVVAKRTKSLKGKERDPYKAAKFVRKNDWVEEDLVAKFDDEWQALATQSLNSVSDGQAGVVGSTEDYLLASLEACGLDEAYKSLASDISSVDRKQGSVVTAAGNKPWYPKGFEPYGSDLAIKWIDNAGVDCFSRCWYWTMDVVAEDGCPSNLYGEMSIEKNGTAIDWTNDSLSSLRPMQKGRLQFITYNDRAYGAQGSLSELSCY